MPLTRTQLMLPPDSSGQVGAVKAGTNITISADGTISSTSGGGVTSITAGSGLSGGVITATGTISILSEGIINSMVSGTAAIESTKLLYALASVPSQTRTVASKLGDVVSIRDFGVLPGNSAAQNNTAMAAAVSAYNANQVKTLYVPAGIYSLSGSYTFTRGLGGIFGDGPRQSIFKPTVGQNLFTVQSLNPSSPDAELARAQDFFMSGLGFDCYSSPAPIRGCVLTLVRPSRSQFTNLDFRGVYQGVNITGASDVMWSDIDIIGNQDPSSSQIGSFLLKIGYADTGPVAGLNSELFFVNLNAKSGGAIGNMGEYGIIIEAGDGIWFCNGHVGFVEKNDVFINIDPRSIVQEVYFDNIYFDGNLTTTTDQTGAILIKGEQSGYPIAGIYFRNCTVKNHYSKPGIEVQATGGTNVSIIGCQISDNGREGIKISGSPSIPLQSTQILDNYFFRNNMANSGSSVITLSSSDMASVVNNTIVGLTNKPPNGIAVSNTCVNTLIGANIIKFCTNAVQNNGVNSLLATQLVVP